MHVALVNNSCHHEPDPFTAELLQLQEKLSDIGIQCDIQPWDRPEVKWDHYSLIIITCQVHYVENVEKFLEWVNRLETMHTPSRLWNSPNIVKWNCYKKYLLELESKNIYIPATVYLDQQHLVPSIQSISDAIHDGLEKYGKQIKEVVIKNVVGAGGLSVWRCKTEVTANGNVTLSSTTVEKIQKQLSSPGGRHGIMIQEFLPEIITDGEWSLIYFDKAFSHAVIKKPPSSSPDNQKDEFRVQESYGGNTKNVPLENVSETLLNFGSRILSLVPDRLLYARIDLVMVGGKEPCLIELELLDPALYFSESSQVTRCFNAIQNLLKANSV